MWLLLPLIQGQILLFTPFIGSQGCHGHTRGRIAQSWEFLRMHRPSAFPVPSPTWKAQDGEVWPALGEPRALLHTTPPEPFILEYGGDWVVIQVLSAPHVHPSGGYAAGQTQEGQEEPHHLARGGGHGFSCWSQASRSKPPPSCWEGARPRWGALLIRSSLQLSVCSYCFP